MSADALAPIWTYRRRGGWSGDLADRLPDSEAAAVAADDGPTDLDDAPGQV